MRWAALAVRGVLIAFSSMAVSSCLAGNAECVDGARECAAEPGAYRECTGGEGYYYWRTVKCGGIAPACLGAGMCQDEASPPACSAQPLASLDLNGDGVDELVTDHEVFSASYFR